MFAIPFLVFSLFGCTTPGPEVITVYKTVDGFVDTGSMTDTEVIGDDDDDVPRPLGTADTGDTGSEPIPLPWWEEYPCDLGPQEEAPEEETPYFYPVAVRVNSQVMLSEDLNSVVIVDDNENSAAQSWLKLQFVNQEYFDSDGEIAGEHYSNMLTVHYQFTEAGVENGFLVTHPAGSIVNFAFPMDRRWWEPNISSSDGMSEYLHPEWAEVFDRNIDGTRVMVEIHDYFDPMYGEELLENLLYMPTDWPVMGTTTYIANDPAPGLSWEDVDLGLQQENGSLPMDFIPYKTNFQVLHSPDPGVWHHVCAFFKDQEK